ncbi:hypothetical protein EGR_08404 [Echinococcus granulosus]|uniref:Uncharacterized protein n=1 Tax=Echinococcus granulosus TaxID=6210 RepID=W6U8L1_ECHGR|nr:hypothetical protein EGR_08404 [Echinococcus granulosus]EUB56761.1 hypothetical protein EGR_08404 [Echinococcus granulosus]
MKGEKRDGVLLLLCCNSTSFPTENNQQISGDFTISQLVDCARIAGFSCNYSALIAAYKLVSLPFAPAYWSLASLRLHTKLYFICPELSNVDYAGIIKMTVEYMAFFAINETTVQLQSQSHLSNCVWCCYPLSMEIPNNNIGTVNIFVFVLHL